MTIKYTFMVRWENLFLYSLFIHHFAIRKFTDILRKPFTKAFLQFSWHDPPLILRFFLNLLFNGIEKRLSVVG